MLRCAIIGETSLSVQCADLLKQRGHAIVALCGPEASPLNEWAKLSSVSAFADISEFTKELSGCSVDYLFSIVNYQLLPPELLAIPRMAINFHDGPLPRYAGVYATSWAIINGEKEHGVTWHVMAEKVDAGDILKQRAVSVSPDETAHSLNMKCFIAGYRAFAALLSELETDSTIRTPQDLSQRTYYGRSRVSPEISWDWGVDRITRVCRALCFHPSPSPVGMLIGKLKGFGFYITKVEPSESAPSGEPVGTVIDETDDYLKIAVADGDVRAYTPKWF